MRQQRLARWWRIVEQLAAAQVVAGLIVAGLVRIWDWWQGGAVAAAGPNEVANLSFSLMNTVTVGFALATGVLMYVARTRRWFVTGARVLMVPLVLGLVLNGTLHYAYARESAEAAAVAATAQLAERSGEPGAALAAETGAGAALAESVPGPDLAGGDALDPRLAALAAEAGIDPANLVAARAQVGKPAGGAGVCGEPGMVGCFANGTIYIFPAAFEQSRAGQRVTLAHEYLHWAWARATVEQRRRLIPYLEAFYSWHRAEFDQRMSVYEDWGTRPGSAAFMDELDSFVGTEVPDHDLPPALLAWYRQWLANRTAVAGVF